MPLLATTQTRDIMVRQDDLMDMEEAAGFTEEEHNEMVATYAETEGADPLGDPPDPPGDPTAAGDIATAIDLVADDIGLVEPIPPSAASEAPPPPLPDPPPAPVAPAEEAGWSVMDATGRFKFNGRPAMRVQIDAPRMGASTLTCYMHTNCRTMIRNDRATIDSLKEWCMEVAPSSSVVTKEAKDALRDAHKQMAVERWSRKAAPGTASTA